LTHVLSIAKYVLRRGVLHIRLGYGKPVIEPKEFIRGNSREDILRNSIIVFSRFTAKTIKKYLERIEDTKLDIPSLESYTGFYRGKRLAVARVCFGAPATIMALELMIAHGLKRAIVIGYAGAINPKLRMTDILLPTWGIREEGTSYHYYPPEHVPRSSRAITDRLYENIKKIKGRRKFRVLKGGIWSIDAIFRETRDKVIEYSRRGILGVDMESTALMCVAEYRNIELAIMLTITDELYRDKWVSIYDDKKLLRKAMKNERLLIKAVLETITA